MSGKKTRRSLKEEEEKEEDGRKKNDERKGKEIMDWVSATVPVAGAASGRFANERLLTGTEECACAPCAPCAPHVL